MTKYSLLLSIKAIIKFGKKKKWPKLMEIKEKGFMHLPMRRAVKLTLSPIERGKDSVDLPNPIPSSVFSRWNRR